LVGSAVAEAPYRQDGGCWTTTRSRRPGKDDMAEIKLCDLVKTYDNGFQAVKGINLHIRDREFMVLVGPSGCGKTTTLRMIAGLEEVSGGEIRIGERRVNEVEPKDRDIAMVFQNYALYPHMTVYENMAYGLKLRKLPKAQIHDKVQAAATMLNLIDHLGKRPKQLSGGQRQRVALGRAIVRQPQVFLFDEPLSNLDAKLRADMRYELKTLQQRLHTTMVYVTHDQIEAMTLGDRITVMSNGEIQQVAAPTVIYDHPYNRFVAAFIGTPEMNFIPGVLIDSGGTAGLRTANGTTLNLALAGSGRLAATAGRTVTLGIRPEHLANIAYQPTPAGVSVLPMQVILLELMGDHQYVYLKGAGSESVLTMKCDAHHRVAVGDTIQVAFAIARAHLFDGEGEFARNISLPEGFAQQQ
jgi:multiple sugar transport system ATP-binding protein